MNGGVLEGKVILVTGAGHGIGRAVATLAAEEGARVVVNDLGGSTRGEGASSSAAEKVAAGIRERGGEAVANGGDVSKYADAQEMVEQSLDVFGRLDGLASIAGKIGRAHVGTPVTNAHLVCRLLLEKK